MDMPAKSGILGRMVDEENIPIVIPEYRQPTRKDLLRLRAEELRASSAKLAQGVGRQNSDIALAASLMDDATRLDDEADGERGSDR